ncbi:MAG: hypothetical protein JOS17DRAFT_747400 [Linnemannia elongata]|nr:MAG: hypothetical protein JOS17DRAFT_747400 [Linnemannia elongata]
MGRRHHWFIICLCIALEEAQTKSNDRGRETEKRVMGWAKRVIDGDATDINHNHQTCSGTRRIANKQSMAKNLTALALVSPSTSHTLLCQLFIALLLGGMVS